jgi:hypothetical protein
MDAMSSTVVSFEVHIRSSEINLHGDPCILNSKGIPRSLIDRETPRQLGQAIFLSKRLQAEPASEEFRPEGSWLNTVPK